MLPVIAALSSFDDTILHYALPVFCPPSLK